MRLPDTSQRLYITGRTGSGKTQFAVWALSNAAFDKQPFIIVDYKRDKLINEIGAIEIDLDERLPKHPGLYSVHPAPEDDDERVNDFLRRIWDRENIGVYFDEIYMVPQKAPLRGILTQGRSKRIPVIALAQRPVWMSRFVISEADFYAIFKLKHPDDKKTLAGFVGKDVMNIDPQKYHCVYYDVSEDVFFNVLPVPSADELLEKFDARLKPKQTFR